MTSATIDPYETFAPDQLERVPDEELDALPFGIIGLDREGIIRRYNVAEARFARLDRARVVGRSFFREVARCTDTPEFFGRFETLLAPDAPLEPLRFAYVFQFRFGAQQVDVDLGRTTNGQRIYAAINRRRFLARQSDFPPSREAPLLRELEPEAEQVGVARDERGRRVLAIDAAMLDALFTTLARTGSGDSLLRGWGARWGQLAVVDLETEALQSESKSLGELSMTRAMELVTDYFQRQRLARVTLDFRHTPRGAIVLTAERSAFADAPMKPACAVVEGVFSRLLTHIARRPLTVREARCAAVTGATACEFVATAASREAALVAATKGASTAPDTVVRSLIGAGA